MSNIYQLICTSPQKQLSLLIDPDKQTTNSLTEILKIADSANVDFIFVGGSIVKQSVDIAISIIKENTNIPVLLFPGSILQISGKADGILFLNLISGRNPDFLIGNHVVAAPILRQTKLEIISTGYILIDGGKTTSVQYMSNSMPIPADKADIAVATALAGEYIGHKLIYLEAGSGALNPVSQNIISAVKKHITIPLLVGGGIRTASALKNACEAGADILVIGTAFEDNNRMINEFADIVHSYSNK